MDGHIFISHSSQDRALAIEVCAILERAGSPCWIAHRDAPAGMTYGRAIIQAIRASWLVVLVLTPDARRSQFVEGEIERAFAARVRILTLRIGATMPSTGLELFVAGGHWLDADVPLTAEHRGRLARAVRVLRSAPPPESTLEQPALPRPTPKTEGHAGDVRSTPHRRSTKENVVGVVGVLGVIAVIGVLGVKGLRSLIGPSVDGAIGLELRSPPRSVSVGDTFSLTAALPGGGPVDPASVAWSSDDPSVVEVDERVPLFTAVAAGDVVLRGELRGARDSVRVTVRSRIASLRIDPPLPLHPGDSLALTLVAQDASGGVVVGESAAWTSTVPEIASVDAETGLVRGRAVGRTTVQARSAGMAAAVEISVVAAPRSVAGRAMVGRDPSVGDDSAEGHATDEPELGPDEVRAFAERCIAALQAGDSAWLAANYHPADTADHENLRNLMKLLGMPGYGFLRSEVDAPDLVKASVGFRTEVRYKRSFGGSATVTTPWHARAALVKGQWRLASCQVDGSPVLR